MAEKPEELTIAQRLGQALDRGQLPAGGPAEAAERLIERLERPARVALLGLPGAGKSAVLNLLAGEPVINEALRLPTVLVRRGGDEQMICTLPDGTSRVLPGRDLEQVLPLTPALITIELQLPALSVISLLEVSAGPAEPDQRRAATWASKRADIVIWCSTSFLPKEQMVWESLPDLIKDNGFLFLTKIDLMGGKEAVAGMVERVELRAGEEFRQVLPLSVANARKAMLAPGGIDRTMFRESGASAVIMAIKSRVEMARRVDSDMAELLLARHAVEPEPPAIWAEPEPDIVAPSILEARVEVASPASAPEPEPEPEQEQAEALSREPEPDQTTSPGSEMPQPQAETPEVPPVPDVPPVPEMPAVEQASKRRFSDRLRQTPPQYEPPVYQPPTVPRQTLGRQPYLPADDPIPETPPIDTSAETADVPAPGKAVRPIARPEPKGGSLRDIFARTEEEMDEAALGMDQPAPVAVPDDDLDVSEVAASEPVPSLLADPGSPEPEAGPEMVPDAQPEPIVEPVAELEAESAPEPRQTVTRPRVTSRLSQALRAAPVAAPADEPSDPAEPAGRVSRRERPRIAPRVVPVAATPPQLDAVADEDRSILRAAVELIMQRSGELLGSLEGLDKIPVDVVLEHGRETAGMVSDLLNRSTSREVRRIAADLGEVQDLIMLMQLEKGHAPADDTVTLLLQLRRDLETLLAA